eukprot:189053-Amphidinium_carterae.1
MALRATKSSRNALCLLVAQTFGILSPFFDLCGTCFHRAVMPVGLRRHWLIWRLPQAFRRNSRCSVDSLELEMIDAGLRWPSMQRCQSCRCIAHVSLLGHVQSNQLREKGTGKSTILTWGHRWFDRSSGFAKILPQLLGLAALLQTKRCNRVGVKALCTSISTTLPKYMQNSLGIAPFV